MGNRAIKRLYIFKYILLFILITCSVISVIIIVNYTDRYVADSEYSWHNPNSKYIRIRSTSSVLEYTEDIGETPLDILKTDEGFEIVSYSKNWTGKALDELYMELLNNRHGIEIEYLDKINIYPDIPPSDIPGAWGSYSTTQENLEYIIKFPPIYDAQLKNFIPIEKGEICLYYGDLIDDISQMSRTLSHEYGHHYTFHYFGNPYIESFSDSLWKKYYEIRELYEYKQVKTDLLFQEGQDYRNNHMWFLHEIAAEDYLQLMGSSCYKTVKRYVDVETALQNSMKEYDYSWNIDFDENTINVYPQENYIIPLPHEIEGLDTFFNSFIDPDYEGKKHKAISRPQLTYKKVSDRWGDYYQFEWTECNNDEYALYTLVGIDHINNILYPIKTVGSGEPKVAKIGKISRESSYGIWSLDDYIAEGNKYFRVYVTYENGSMLSSDPVHIEFD